MKRVFSPSPRIFFGLGLLLAASCSERNPVSLEWRFRFANPETAKRADHVDIKLVRGSCSSKDVVYETTVERDSTVPEVPALPSGSYSLSGRAVSADCKTIAIGCLQTALPPGSGETIEVVLDDIAGAETCEGACAKMCAPDRDASPAAMNDAALDGSSLDASSLDASSLDAATGDGGAADANAGTDAMMAPTCDGAIGPNGHCYGFFDVLADWPSAEDACVKWGGHLVSFNDEAEELWVSNEASKFEKGTRTVRFWIGFTDQANERTWLWTDGSGVSKITFNVAQATTVRFKADALTPYTHWGPNDAVTGNGEPNNGNAGAPDAQDPGEDCAGSRSDRKSGPLGITPRPEWDDSNCSTLKNYVCEHI